MIGRRRFHLPRPLLVCRVPCADVRGSGSAPGDACPLRGFAERTAKTPTVPGARGAPSLRSTNQATPSTPPAYRALSATAAHATPAPAPQEAARTSPGAAGYAVRPGQVLSGGQRSRFARLNGRRKAAPSRTRRAAPAMLFPPARFSPLRPPFRASPLQARNPAGGQTFLGGNSTAAFTARLQWARGPPPRALPRAAALRVAGCHSAALPPLRRRPPLGRARWSGTARGSGCRHRAAPSWCSLLPRHSSLRERRRVAHLLDGEAPPRAFVEARAAAVRAALRLPSLAVAATRLRGRFSRTTDRERHRPQDKPQPTDQTRTPTPTLRAAPRQTAAPRPPACRRPLPAHAPRQRSATPPRCHVACWPSRTRPPTPTAPAEAVAPCFPKPVGSGASGKQCACSERRGPRPRFTPTPGPVARVTRPRTRPTPPTLPRMTPTAKTAPATPCAVGRWRFAPTRPGEGGTCPPKQSDTKAERYPPDPLPERTTYGFPLPASGTLLFPSWTLAADAGGLAAPGRRSAIHADAQAAAVPARLHR